VDITAVTEGMRVRLRGPEGHELHGATGTVSRVLSTGWLWEHDPVTMMSDPFAWTDGQVLVSLDERPRSQLGRNLPWTPAVAVRPGDIEPA